MNDVPLETKIPVAVLYAFCQNALESVGVSPDDASVVADSLTKADACGLTSHGVVRLLPVYISRIERDATRAKPNIRIVERGPSTALVDGDAGIGQVVGHRAMSLAIELAQASGAGVVGVRNSSHFGTTAFFLEQATRAGMIALAMTNAPSNVPPHGGRSPYFGTNPLGIALPCGSEPDVILDMSTSVVARGKITMLQKNGQSEIPLGWAIDADGNPTTSTEAALLGAVLPMAGYKGAGLALVIDALCGVLTGAAYNKLLVSLYEESKRPQNIGHFFVAIDPQRFVPLDLFKARMDAFVRDVRQQPRQPGVDRIYVPGEIEFEREQQGRRQGLAMSEAERKELNELAKRLDIPSLHKMVMPAN